MRVKLLSLLVCLAALGVFVPSAGALTYCLSATAMTCSGGPSYDMTQAGLQQAITDAQGNGVSTDVIEIGAGTIDITSPMSFTTSAANTIQISGVGNGYSYFHTSIASGTALQITATGAGSDAIANMKFKIDGSPSSSRRAFQQIGGRSTGLAFDVASESGIRTTGFLGSGGAECQYCDFKLTGSGAAGIYAAGDTTLKGGSFTATNPLTDSTSGVDASFNGTLNVESATFKGLYRAVQFDSGTVNVRDSLIDLGARASAVGVFVENMNASTSSLLASLDGVTIFGTGASQTGVHVASGSTAPGGEHATGLVTNSLLLLTGAGSVDLACYEDAVGGDSQLNASWSLVRSTSPVMSGGGICGSSMTNNAASDSKVPADLFVNAASGNFRLKDGASVIDQGDPAVTSGSRGNDASGGTRVVDSTGSGTPRIDMGGLEHQNYQPNDPTLDFAPTTATVGTPIQFSATATDDNSGDTISYTWAFGDGEYAYEANPVHVYTSAGTFSVSVIAYDGEFQSYQTSALITITEPPAPSGSSDNGAPAFSLTLGKQKGKASLKKMMGAPKIGEATARAAGQVPITASESVDVKITLLRVRAGYLVGDRCGGKQGSSGRPKRCDLVVGKARAFRIPAGTSQFTLGRKWGGRKLTPGRYRIAVSTSKLKDSLKSTLNVIR